ncbi:MAG: response regulator transcription factor [Acidobacteria bacterium]|nr:response regulator transcription factor [Acidobacteriota bacterium]
MTLRAYLVDDEPLALKRLSRLLKVAGGVEVVGSATDPGEALRALAAERVDVLFLDIQMPGMNGFELLAKLDSQPLVIFTTAHDSYALRAFEVSSIDYLLKPVEAPQLDRALRKLAQLRELAGSLSARAEFQALVSRLAREFTPPQRERAGRICSRVGDRIVFIELEEVTHFYSKDRLTFAATGAKKYVVDYTISELEERLTSKGFLRIHRATLLNLSLVGELYRWFGGRMRVRLKDKDRTELTVARDQVKTLKEKLGLR